VNRGALIALVAALAVIGGGDLPAERRHVAGGADIIRGQSTNGLVWTIDANAPGATPRRTRLGSPPASVT
jgi:hypothetical protein